MMHRTRNNQFNLQQGIILLYIRKKTHMKEWNKLSGEAVESWSLKDLKPDIHVSVMVNTWTLHGHVDTLNIPYNL